MCFLFSMQKHILPLHSSRLSNGLLNSNLFVEPKYETRVKIYGDFK